MLQIKNNKYMDGKAISALLVAAALLSACGQRSDEETPTDRQPTYNANGELVIDGNSSEPEVTSGTLGVRVISNVNSISTGGTDVATITALVTDENNNAVEGQPVVFSSTGGVLQNISAATNENGEATATLSLPHDFQNQDIMVNVTADSFESDVRVTALGSRLEISGPSSLVAGDQAELVVRLIAGNDEPIANQAITVSSTAGNVITPSEAITDADGQVTVYVGSQNSSDTIQIRALNSSVAASHSFDVSSDILQFASDVDGAEYPVGGSEINTVRVTWAGQSGPVVGQDLRFSITAGSIISPATVTTDASGQASVNVQSSSAGPAKLSVEAASTGTPKTSVDFEFVATDAADVIIDATTSLVNINETSTISARVIDDLGNPVKNQEVDFNGDDLKGGQLNPASAITNSAGIANVTFTAGATATEADAITVEATVKGTTINDSLQLTVFKRSLNVTLGTSNRVIVKSFDTQHAVPFVVQVADGSGTPLENATVKLTIRPLAYGKGYMHLVDQLGRTPEQAVADGENFSSHHWAKINESIDCPTEDLNGNRVLDTVGGLDEDTNNNGSLDPQDPASLAAVEGESATLSGGMLVTDNNGSGFFELLYPSSNALWADVEIIARAEALGSEAEDTFKIGLPALAADILDTDVSPPSVVSPYGHQDLDNTLLKNVVLDGLTLPVLTGCETSY